MSPCSNFVMTGNYLFTILLLANNNLLQIDNNNILIDEQARSEVSKEIL